MFDGTILQSFLQCLAPVFTSPSFDTHARIVVGWVMCLGSHSEFRVFRTIFADQPLDRNQRHPFDRFYNFFSRSSWAVADLAYFVALRIVADLMPDGVLCLIVDDTLLHKKGARVYGLGWFRDAVASTAKRVATASGNHWVVLGIGVQVPLTDMILCLPIHFRLHQSGQGKGEGALAKEMLKEVLRWFPDRRFVLVADGGYSNANLLGEWDSWVQSRVEMVGVIRGDAAIYDPTPPPRPKGKRGPKPKKGPRLPSPKEAIRKANRAKSENSPWTWNLVEVAVYGVTRNLQALSYQAVWPKVFGSKPILVVVIRDPERRFKDTFLFTTNLQASLHWVIVWYSWRWSIEVAFKASKQVMQIQAPRHWCKESILKLAPWVWLMQSMITVWYLTEGRKTTEAAEERSRMGAWDSEWSFRHMLRILRLAILRDTINRTTGRRSELQKLIHRLENYLNLAA